MAPDRQVTQAFERGVIRLKSKDFPIGIITLLDQILLKLVVTWQFVAVEVGSMSPLEAEEDPWKVLKIDMAQWADLAGLGTRATEEGFERLKTMGAIYPDGTHPSEVELYIVEKAYGLLGQPTPGEDHGGTISGTISNGKLH